MYNNIDENGKLMIENIKTTLACENQFLSQNDIDTLAKIYSHQISPDEAMTMIKNDIAFRVVK